MREYAKVSPLFWTGETGRAVIECGSAAIAIAMYLMTNPHANALGLYYLPLAYMAHDLKSTLEGASKGLLSCIEAHFCDYDKASEMVWVYEMARFQTGTALKTKDNRHKSTVKLYARLPKCPFLGPFFDKYAEDFNLPERRETKGLTSPLQAPSKQGEGKGEGEEKGEGECRNADAMRLARLLFSEIKKNNPGHKPPNFNRWSEDIDKAIRIDGRSVAELEELILFAQGDDFWRVNILSGRKLREKYDKLFLEMHRDGPRSGAGQERDSKAILYKRAAARLEHKGVPAAKAFCQEHGLDFEMVGLKK